MNEMLQQYLVQLDDKGCVSTRALSWIDAYLTGRTGDIK